MNRKCPNCGAPLSNGKCEYCKYQEPQDNQHIVIETKKEVYIGPNLFIRRGNKKPWGEANTKILIDGIDYGNLNSNVTTDIQFHMSPGWHTIQFKRAALKSDLLKFEVNDQGMQRFVICTPKTLSLEMIIR